jgi:hypothetical protein
MSRPTALRAFIATVHAIGAALMLSHTLAATPVESAFIENFRKAYETNDTKALHGFLYSKGADRETLDMFKMMVTMGAGQKLTSVELIELTDADKKKISSAMGPGGKPMKSPIPITKKLVMKKTVKTANENSTSTSATFVGVHEGKIVIPVPGVAK